jgi:aspartate/methionine/tyrosine aminotransferase
MSAASPAVVPSAAARRAFSPERSAAITAVPASGVAALHKGDSCFPTPDHIREAHDKAVRDGNTHYAAPQGDPELRKAIADYVDRNATGRAWTADDVLVTCGATEALFCVFVALLDAGDEVLIFDPTYSAYAPVIRQIGAQPVPVPMMPDFRLDEERLRAHLTPRTKMIVINNPANPTGVVFTREELQAVVTAAVEANILVVTDEVYDRLVFAADHVPLTLFPELDDRLIYVNSFSKSFAMTGWRLGYVAAEPYLLAPMQAIHENVVMAIPSAVQRAGVAALTGPQGEVDAMHRGYAERRAVLLEGLAGLPRATLTPPQGAFYGFVRFDVDALALESSELTSLLLADGVAVRSGTEYGAAGRGCLRLSFSSDLADIRQGTRILHERFAEQLAACD